MIIDYFVNNFGTIVMVVGIIGFGVYLVVGRGKDKDAAIRDFDNKIKSFDKNNKVGSELSNPQDDSSEDCVDFRTDLQDDRWPPIAGR